MKTQRVRILDVLAIGPLMVWGGMHLRDEHPSLGSALALMGVGTVLYNTQNYLRVVRGEFLRGGRAAGRKPSSFDPVQLMRGIRVEMEHTVEPDIAREIAMDHLAEDPLYYDKLISAGL